MSWPCLPSVTDVWGGMHDLLFVQDDVRQPDRLRRHSDGGNAPVVVRIPLQLHVNPLL